MSISNENIKSIDYSKERHPKNKKMMSFIPKNIKIVLKVNDNLQKIRSITNIVNTNQFKNIKEMIKHIDQSGNKYKIKSNKKLFKIENLNTSYTNHGRERANLSIKAIESEEFKEKIRSSSYLKTETPIKSNQNRNDYISCSKSLNSSKLKDEIKIVKLSIESKRFLKQIPKSELKGNLKSSVIPVNSSDKNTFLTAINRINSSINSLKSNASNTIINIHNNINIKIKDNKDNEIGDIVSEKKENICGNVKIGKKLNLKQITLKNLKKSFDIPKKDVLIAFDKVNTNSPSKLIEIKPKIINISSLLNIDRTKTKSNSGENENSLISFDNSLISLKKKESFQSVNKNSSNTKEKNDEISLSYSDDEKNNKLSNNKNKMMNSIDVNDSENDDEFIKFCENLNKKILI